jgi:hypothetical protein
MSRSASHEGGSGENPYLDHTGNRFDRGIMGHVVSHPLEMMQSMCLGGVLKRHPRLRVAFLEDKARARRPRW